MTSGRDELSERRVTLGSSDDEQGFFSLFGRSH